MKVLVVGLGSIGVKHVDALRSLEPDVAVFALRSGHSNTVCPGVSDIRSWSDAPKDLSFVIVSNPTDAHLETIEQAARLKVPLFIEKPPLMDLQGAEELLRMIERERIRTYVAFNLRFHPVINWLKSELSQKRVLEVQAYCGSNLANWRPQQDYRKSYSATTSRGGGVHLDLIHELDYVTWLFGAPHRSMARTTRVSDLDIESADSAHYWLEYPRMVASITLNYFRVDPQRTMEIVMQDDSWRADLLNGTVTAADGSTLFTSKEAVQRTYARQMEYFLATLNQDVPFMNTLAEALETLKLCLGHAER